MATGAPAEPAIVEEFPDAQYGIISDNILDKNDDKIIGALKGFLRIAVWYNFESDDIWRLAHGLFLTGNRSRPTSIADDFPKVSEIPKEGELAKLLVFFFDVIEVEAKRLGLGWADPELGWDVCADLLRTFTDTQSVTSLYGECVSKKIESQRDYNLTGLRLWLNGE